VKVIVEQRVDLVVKSGQHRYVSESSVEHSMARRDYPPWLQLRSCSVVFVIVM
jgi:hypothetical protein